MRQDILNPYDRDEVEMDRVMFKTYSEILPDEDYETLKSGFFYQLVEQATLRLNRVVKATREGVYYRVKPTK